MCLPCTGDETTQVNPVSPSAVASATPAPGLELGGHSRLWRCQPLHTQFGARDWEILGEVIRLGQTYSIICCLTYSAALAVGWRLQRWGKGYTSQYSDGKEIDFGCLG